MAYCHECSEEIAEIDIFCPHCGISLPPPPGVVEEVESAANNKSETTEPTGKADSNEGTAASPEKYEEDPIPPKSLEGGPAVGADPSGKRGLPTDERSVSVTDENFAIVSETLETPAVAVEEESIKVPEQTESADSIEGSAPDSSDPVAPEKHEPDQIGTPTEPPVPESEIGSIAESEISKPAFSETAEKRAPVSEIESTDLVPEKSEIGDVEEFIKTMPYVPGMEKNKPLKQSGETPQQKVLIPETGETEQPELGDLPRVSGERSISPEPVKNIETPEPVKNIETPEPVKEIETPEPVDLPGLIAKPDGGLAGDEDLPDEKSEFDSVRIMENTGEILEDSGDVAEKVLTPETPPKITSPEPVKTPPPAVKTESEEVAEPSPDEERRDSRSYTTPNIGVSDTDGNKSKLKPLEEGTVLNGRYEIIRKIGGGGMGAVYLASDKNLGGVLRAVKEMVQSYIEEKQQEKAIQDFKRESLLLTSLEHQSIPTIYDYFYDEKEARFYLVMKYINGGDLSSRLRSAPEGRIDEKSVTEWAIQIVDVLDYLHKRQPPIVYRDLKPANIMIDGNTGRVMLIDFGIARWINKEEKGVTAVGTMGYAPPELFSGNVEPSSDIYSLGSTMFHMLTGADPQSNPLLIFDFQKNPLPRQINPQISDQMERILMRAVEYNADKRFHSAAELRAELTQHLKNLKKNLTTYGIGETPKSVSLSSEKVFCGFCGQSIVASDLFCAFCGSKQPIAQKGVHGESYSSVPLTARLEILGTNELESPAYTIEKDENLVGRRDPMSNIFPEVDLSKYDPQTKISRRHARIWRENNKYLVEDLGSSNGTVLMPVVSDAIRLEPNKPHILTNGDKLKLGDTTLHFVLG